MMDVQKIRKDIIALMYDNPDAALEQTNRLVAKMPGEVWALQLRSSVFEIRGDIEEAFKDLDEVIKIKPNEPSPHFKKATIYFDLEDFRQAIVEFSKVIEIGNMYSFLYFHNHSHFMRAFCHYKIGNFDTANLDLDIVDEDTRTWVDRLWTKEELVEACRNKRLS